MIHRIANCCLGVWLLAASAPGLAAEARGDDRDSLEFQGNESSSLATGHHIERVQPQLRYFSESEAAVLRQKTTVPLELLVRPISLSDLTRMNAASGPPLSQPQAGPVLDAAASDPFADDPVPDGSVPPGKLIGIVGRAVFESIPLPSVDDMREQLPGLPSPGPAEESRPLIEDPETEFGAVPADEDPFGADAIEQDNVDAEEPVDAADEDPFGGF